MDQQNTPSGSGSAADFTFAPQAARKLCAAQRKRRWLSRLDALMAVADLGNTGRAYRCPACGYWHVSRRKAVAA